jgi:hypothetical protein
VTVRRQHEDRPVTGAGPIERRRGSSSVGGVGLVVGLAFYVTGVEGRFGLVVSFSFNHGSVLI